MITVLISATVVLTTFSFQLKLTPVIAETFYELEPEEEAEKEEEEVKETDSDSRQNEKPQTNRAFNESQQQKRFAQAYRTITPPKDFEPSPSEAEDEVLTEDNSVNTPAPIKAKPIDKSDYEKVNSLLKKKLDKGQANLKSTISYSLKNRQLLNNPTPIYLCDDGGKVVVNITVSSKGYVVKAGINKSASTANECLHDHAVEYAKKARFSTASKTEQTGTITFMFQGK